MHLPSLLDPALVEEAQRQLTICNSCRYCEGYCAVFPSLELRMIVEPKDAVHLANLCHDCRACFYACMYAAPHEFAVNIPEALSAIRVETYREYGWPAVAARLFGQGPRGVVVGSLIGVIGIIGLIFAFGEPHRMLERQTGPGSFYLLLPYAAMVSAFLLVSGFVAAVMFGSFFGYWRDTRGRLSDLLDRRALGEALGDAFSLKYLRGGGAGCYYPSDTASQRRRLMHSLVFYGFLSDTAATISAAIMQDLLDQMPPYPLLSVPVVLGTIGGIAMIIGSTALVRMKWQSDVRPAFAKMVSKDYGFLLSLDLVSITGLLVLLTRETAALGPVLAIHLGSVAAFFLAMPYGKFVHFLYRYGALVQNRLEEDYDHRVLDSAKEA